MALENRYSERKPNSEIRRGISVSGGIRWDWRAGFWSLWQRQSAGVDDPWVLLSSNLRRFLRTCFRNRKSGFSATSNLSECSSKSGPLGQSSHFLYCYCEIFLSVYFSVHSSNCLEVTIKPDIKVRTRSVNRSSKLLFSNCSQAIQAILAIFIDKKLREHWKVQDSKCSLWVSVVAPYTKVSGRRMNTFQRQDSRSLYLTLSRQQPVKTAFYHRLVIVVNFKI